MIKIKAWRFFPVMMALVLVASVGAAIVPAIPVKATCPTPMVAAGQYHTVGLKSDGTVVAVGDNSYGQCNVSSWTGITQVAAGEIHTVGLKSDGTVVAVGDDFFVQCSGVSSWTGITQVAAGQYHTVGLKSDGTVVAVGNSVDGQLNVGSWTGITQVAAGGADTVGLKSDGTVVAVGSNSDGQRNVGSWTGITQVAEGGGHTVGLKSDGTVVAVGYNGYGQCSGVSSWTGITQVSAGWWHTVGLKSDGTVVAAGDNSYGQCNVTGWTGITQVAAGEFHTVGLKSDGTVVAVGRSSEGQCSVGSWNLLVTTVTCTASPNPTEVGHAVHFTSSASCGVPPYTYSWAFGDGGTSTAQNPNHTYTATGTPTATVTVTDSLAETANCSKIITVNSAVSAACTAIPNPTEVGHAVHFTCTPSGGVPPYTYSWTFGDGGTSTAQNPTYTYTATGTPTATVTVTDSLAETANCSKIITVNPPVIAACTASPNPTEVGHAVNFTSTPSNGVPPYTYSWTFGDSTTSTAQNPTHTYTAAGTPTATVTVTDSLTETANCSKIITVNPPVIAACTASPNPTEVGHAVNFTSTPSNGVPPYTYSWTLGDNTTSTAQNPTHTYTAAGTPTATVTVTDSLTETANCSKIITVNQPTQSVNTATGTGVATFTTSSGSITNLTASATTPCGSLAGFSFPHGFFSFNITNLTPGATVTITITLPSSMPVGTQYWKCINGQGVDCTSLLGHNDGDNILTLTIIDGGLGDADGQANGTIVDPGGPVLVGGEAGVLVPEIHRVSPTLLNNFKPAQMSLQYLSVSPQQTAANQPVTVLTNVVNTGDETGSLNVVLKINGQAEQTRTVSVGPQAAQPVKFIVTKAQPGTYAIDIGGQRGSFSINGAGSSATSTGASGMIIAIILGALVLIAVLVLLIARRPSQ